MTDKSTVQITLAQIFHELLSRGHEDGRVTWQPQGVGSEAYPERYVAGADTRGRQEGRPYPWSQQVIHEISGLGQSVGKLHKNIPSKLLSGRKLFGCLTSPFSINFNALHQYSLLAAFWRVLCNQKTYRYQWHGYRVQTPRKY